MYLYMSSCISIVCVLYIDACKSRAHGVQREQSIHMLLYKRHRMKLSTILHKHLKRVKTYNQSRLPGYLCRSVQNNVPCTMKVGHYYVGLYTIRCINDDTRRYTPRAVYCTWHLYMNTCTGHIVRLVVNMVEYTTHDVWLWYNKPCSMPNGRIVPV
jgi:hypothetical protein